MKNIKIKLVNFFLVFVVLAIAGMGVYVMTQGKTPLSQPVSVVQSVPKCPDDYATAEEQTAGMVKWENDFYDSHPGASLLDMAQARLQFFKDNNCTAALQRYEDAKTGKADPAAMERIKNGIKNTINQRNGSN